VSAKRACASFIEAQHFLHTDLRLITTTTTTSGLHRDESSKAIPPIAGAISLDKRQISSTSKQSYRKLYLPAGSEPSDILQYQINSIVNQQNTDIKK